VKDTVLKSFEEPTKFFVFLRQNANGFL
jgi:hypothetical protein